MKALLRITLVAGAMMTLAGCPAPVGSKNKNQDPNAPMMEHSETSTELPKDDPPG